MASNDKIQIQPEKLNSVQNTYDDMSSQLKSPEGIVGDSASLEAMTSGKEAITATSKNTKSMLSSLDIFLQSVGQSFKEKDVNLAMTIEGKDPTPDTLSGIQNSESYKRLRKENTDPLTTPVPGAAGGRVKS